MSSIPIMAIISFIVGFSGNKLFNKKDKSTNKCIKWGCVTSSVLVILHLILMM
ncbi:hypothetical protein [Clostridium carboxidivorans]|uniref:hypothetical protein n=1 Tax=Clostridium carboxidivorans TaxID=217159 RepID=UPI0012E276F9|nr:hypothetical protein [Clostridium carboxidivorans]